MKDILLPGPHFRSWHWKDFLRQVLKEFVPFKKNFQLIQTYVLGQETQRVNAHFLGTVKG